MKIEHVCGVVYFLTMERGLFETDVRTLETRPLADLVEELKIPKGAQPHFKAEHTVQGRLVVANNTCEEPEFLNKRAGGRLAEWDGKSWTVLEENPFVEVSGNRMEIEVANLRTNRLLFDATLPPDKRLTTTNVTGFKPDMPLLPSGLLGRCV